jgi:alpha-glucosidase (family GH31 glycosyl hydrolase)
MDGQEYDGGQWISVHAKIDEIPVFVRKGNGMELEKILKLT